MNSLFIDMDKEKGTSTTYFAELCDGACTCSQTTMWKGIYLLLLNKVTPKRLQKDSHMRHGKDIIGFFFPPHLNECTPH